jgi:hypothetical protein
MGFDMGCLQLGGLPVQRHSRTQVCCLDPIQDSPRPVPVRESTKVIRFCTSLCGAPGGVSAIGFVIDNLPGGGGGGVGRGGGPGGGPGGFGIDMSNLKRVFPRSICHRGRSHVRAPGSNVTLAPPTRGIATLETGGSTAANRARLPGVDLPASARDHLILHDCFASKFVILRGNAARTTAHCASGSRSSSLLSVIG